MGSRNLFERASGVITDARHLIAECGKVAMIVAEDDAGNLRTLHILRVQRTPNGLVIRVRE